MYENLYNAIPKEKYAVSNIMLERIDENGVTHNPVRISFDINVPDKILD